MPSVNSIFYGVLYVAYIIYISAPVLTMTHLKLYYLQFKDKKTSQNI